MLANFKESIRQKELSNLRLLNVFVAVIVTVLGFVFEFAYHNSYILVAGLFVSMVFLSNYFLSFYNHFYRNHFLDISYSSILLLHTWAVCVAYLRQFDIAFLLPVALSIFIFSLIFDKFYKSFLFIFAITTFMLVMMWNSHHWQTDYTIAVAALYSGAFAANVILRRKKEYHNEIDKREKRYITLVENMNDGLIYLNNKNELLFVNDRFCEISGYFRNELIGKNFLQLFGATVEDSPALRFFEQLKTSEKKEPLRCECKIEKKNSETSWVALSGTPIFNDHNERTGNMVVFNDISALKDIQEQLKKREEGYRTFIDQSAVGIWRAEYQQPIPTDISIAGQIELLLDTGRISECNESMAKMYGYECPHQLIGRRLKDFYYIENKFDEQKTHELLTTFIINNYRLRNEESKKTDQHGNLLYILNNNIGIVENGFLVRTWGVQTDITDRKKIERELHETNQELDTFFYKASHDLKGPLASIRGIINLARIEEKRIGGSENQRDGETRPHSPILPIPDSFFKITGNYFGLIEGSVKRLDSTLMDLIELARTRQGVSKLTAINIKSMTDEILESLSHVEGYDKICFEIHIDSSIELVADKVLLQSVFQNLIHNSINYSNDKNPGILIHVRETGDGIELEITDNGKGIAENIRHKVFDMFYRGHPDSVGSGLGLFIVKNALEKMKGKIRFESEEGKGTSFFVDIPNALVEA